MARKATPIRKAPQRPDKLQPIGVTGLKRYGQRSVIQEEFLSELRGPQGVRVYREMISNDATIGAMLYAIEIMLSRVKWRADGENEADVEFLESCISDMYAPSFPAFISEVMSMIAYGWSWHAVGYKRRAGYSENPTLNSKFSDGLIGWSGFPIRSQDSLVDWEWDENGNLAAMRQLAPPNFKLTDIPLSRSLLFRVRQRKDSPEGVSLLRSAYRPWYRKREIENIQGIAIERDLAGIPVARVDGSVANIDAPGGGGTVYQVLQKIVTNIKQNEQSGIVLPNNRDENGNRLVELELLSASGAKQIDTTPILQDLSRQIAMVLIADFMLIGHEGVGSYALVDSKTDLWALGLGAINKIIADCINDNEVPRLFRLNGKPTDNLPYLIPGDIEDRDLKALGDFLVALSSTGFPLWPNKALESYCLNAANLPEPTEDERAAIPEVPENPQAEPGAEPMQKYNDCHGAHDGRFCATPGSGGGGSVSGLKPAKGRVFTGEPVELKTKLSKLETGSVGEKVVIAYLKSKGFGDARSTNVKVNNFAVDLVHDHEAFEVKAGLVSNGKSAQQWRATIGQPGKAETAWLKKASPEAKRAWNEKKGQEILKRKQDALAKLSKQLGRKVKGNTYTVILNPDTKRADLFAFSGFHLRIPWGSAQAKAGYLGTYSYE